MQWIIDFKGRYSDYHKFTECLLHRALVVPIMTIKPPILVKKLYTIHCDFTFAGWGWLYFAGWSKYGKDNQAFNIMTIFT